MQTRVSDAARYAWRSSAGVAAVSWRYLWSITPLHRSTQVGDATDGPPAAPREHLASADSQPLCSGAGPLYHRLFAVDIADAAYGADQLVAELATDLNRAVPAEVAVVEPISAEFVELRRGEMVRIRIPGPWNGPVRVIHREPTSFRLATLRGHMEAGQIEFRARRHDGLLRFEIEAWARPATRAVDLLFTRLWLASEIQVNMWVRFCRAAAGIAGGRVHDGITIRTRIVKDAGQLARCAETELGRVPRERMTGRSAVRRD